MRAYGIRGTLVARVALMMASAVAATAVAQTQYPIMRPDEETLRRWFGDYNRAAELRLDPTRGPVGRTSHSLLPYLPHVPVERNQDKCGNCWVWAGTGCVEIAHYVENGVFDRLSIQYFNSNYAGGTGPNYACCGGWLSEFVDFYEPIGFVMPWSNSNAHWQDAGTRCVDSTTVPGASIGTIPNYRLAHIDDLRIATQGETQATAIANIKAALDADMGVWFAYFLADFGPFFDFWYTQGETAVWDFDGHCGGSYDGGNPDRGGHAVLCVGYNDDDPANPYWIMVNSWGTTADRPRGTFRVDMDIDYSCQFTDLGYALFWQAVDIDFDKDGNPTVSEWGMVVIVLLLVTGITIKFGRRRVVRKAA